jgi:hypothetical protein
VLIFGVGTLMLVTTMLTLSDTSAKSEGQRHRAKALQMVVRYGIGQALIEINRSRAETGYTDPTGNGFGTILTGAGPYSDGLQGWPVRTNGTTGQLLGRFRSVVRTTSGVHVLSVVAVYPDFTNPVEMAAAEIEIRRGKPPFDRNALSIRGDADAGGAPGVTGFSNKVDIYGNDPTAGAQPVPAVNVSDPSSYASFISNVNKFGTVSGVGGVDSHTVTQNDAGILSEANLLKIAEGINARVLDIKTSGTNLNATSLALLTAGALPLDGDFYIDSSMNITTPLVGSGTLVIAKDVLISSKVDWDGEIILANEDGARLRVDQGSELNVFGPKGVLAVQGVVVAGDTAPTGNMGISVKGRLNVDGAFTVMGNTNSATLFVQEPGARIDVTGIMTVMGNNLAMDLDNGSELNVYGSLALVTPSGSARGVDIDFVNGVGMKLTFINTNFDESLSILGGFFDPAGKILPVSTPSYWERAPKLVLASQTTTLGGTVDANSNIVTSPPWPNSTTYEMAP